MDSQDQNFGFHYENVFIKNSPKKKYLELL